MGTITSLMNIAQQALLADQAGLNVTASNVANQATAGYTVETVSQQAQDTVSVNGGSYGDGVTASAPQSQRNRVLEQQVQQQMQVQSQSSAMETALDQVQNVFGISSASSSSSLTQLGTAVDGFFSSLTALASNPSDTATREGVLSAASNLANTFNSTAAQLASIGSSLNSQAATLVGQANTLTAQIAALNQQISVVSPNGDAGVLEDQRQEAIEQLSQFVGLDQIATSGNGIDLTTSNGAALVSGFTSYPLSTAVVNGQTQVYDGSTNTAGVSSNPASVALASVGGTATPGTYTVVVNSLATAATANSAVLTDPTSVLSGTLTLGATTLTVSAANGNNTLATLAQAINSANLGVTASVITTASGSSLALTSPGTAGQTLLSGITNALTYTTQTNTTPTALALNAGATGVDASLTVNGAAVSSPTNNVSTAVPGVLFIAVAPGTGTLQISAPITGGQLGGTLQVLDQQLPAAESSIDALAYALGSAVNTQNSAGIDANGNPGADLFTLGLLSPEPPRTSPSPPPTRSWSPPLPPERAPPATPTRARSPRSPAPSWSAPRPPTNTSLPPSPPSATPPPPPPATAPYSRPRSPSSPPSATPTPPSRSTPRPRTSPSTSAPTKPPRRSSPSPTPSWPAPSTSASRSPSPNARARTRWPAHPARKSAQQNPSPQRQHHPSTTKRRPRPPAGKEELSMQVDPNYIQNLVGSLNTATANEAQLTNELSSGLGVTSLSSDPAAVGQSTLLSAAISQDDSYVQASATAQSQLQLTDSALGEVVSQLTSALSVAVQGANGTQNATDQISTANQLSAIRDQVLSLANTEYLGQYVFSGSDGSVQPFTQDTSTTPATTTYNGDTALQYTTTENGQQIQTNLPGSSVFTSPGANVFSALNQIVSDFSSGASADTLQSDTTQLSTALNGVITQRSVLDNSLSQLESTSTYAQTNATQLQAAQSTLVSADTASIATQLSSTETQSQALMSSISTLEKNSLFDYIK